MRAYRAQSAFSAIEILIAVTLFALIITAISPLFTAASRSWEKDRKLKEMIQRSRDTMDFMVNELKKTNNIIDGTDANLSTADVLDSYYVVFGTSGEEIYLDNRNSGYKMDNPALFNAGIQSGGFAGDYDGTATGIATYSFTTPLNGFYDIYGYFLSTADATASISLYDGANADISSTFSQSSSNALKWYKVCDSDITTTDCGANRIDLSTAGPYSIRVARSVGTSNLLVDGYKLVYRGNRHKVFYYNAAANKITYGSDNGGFAALALNPALLDFVSPVGASPVFSYFQSNGVTPATSASNVALVKIVFQVIDPEGKLQPFVLRAGVDIRSAVEGNTGAGVSGNKLVINEINLQTPNKVLGFNNFDGTISNMDNDNFGWETENLLTGRDYGWLSMLENFDDGEADPPSGWFTGGQGTWATEVDATAPKPAGNRVYSGIGNANTNQRNNKYFYESSENLKWEFQFRVAAQGALEDDQFGGARKCSTFGVYLRSDDPTLDNKNLVYVEFLRKGATCAGGTAYVRVAKREASYLAISGDVVSLATFDDGNWHTAVVRDMWGKISVSLDGTTYINAQNYNSGAQQITNTNLLPLRKAIFVWSNSHVHFDDLKITSYDFKPVAYLTDFEGLYSDWFSLSPAGSPGVCGWATGTITSGPGSAYSGTRAAATNPAGNYNQNCEEEWYHYPVNMQPSLLRFSFPFVHFFSWQDYPAAQTADCVVAQRANNTATQYYVNEANVFPLDANGQVITAPLNSFQVPPGAYDATCSNAIAFFNGKRAWTNNHQPGWTEIAYPIPEFNDSTVMRVTLPFASDNTATVAAGHYVDDVKAYPGGEWERMDTPTGPGTCFNGSYCWGMVDGGPDYSNYQHNALETPTVITPAWTQKVALSWVQWRDFEAATTFYDGGFVEYSLNNGQTWTQFTDLELSVGYDPCVIGSDPDLLSPTYCTIPSTGAVCQNNAGNFTYCNELQGYNGWTFDDQSWVKVTATLTGAGLANNEVKFRFHFASDNVNTAEGWFIDDVKVTASPQTNYDWIELYNPTPYNVDAVNFRIVMEHSYQDAPVAYDVLSGDAANGSGSTVIGPYGYAIITANTPSGSTNVYDGISFTLPPESAQARRLTIDDNAFGTLGLQNKFGKLQLQYNNGNLVDEVDYNVVFYDDMENYAGGSAASDYMRFYSVQDWGNSTHWAVGTPVSGNGPGRDHTRNAPGTGNVWFLCTDPANTTCEDYVNGAETGLIPQSFNFSGASVSNPPYLEFYFWNNVDNNNRRDGMLLEVSTTGGSDFVQDPANPDTIQLAGNLLNPGYYSRTINQASNVLNGLFTYSRDITTWTQVTANLSAYTAQIINLRFMFGADNGTSAGGPFLDDIAVYYDWGNLNTNWDGVTPVLTNTLERKNWNGDSSDRNNWAASIAPNNAAPIIGTPNGRNSVTQ